MDWRAWFDQFTATRFKQIAVVDLGHPRAVPRNGLISEILKATGRSNAAVPPPPNDLPYLADAFENGSRVIWRSSISIMSRTALITATIYSVRCAGS